MPSVDWGKNSRDSLKRIVNVGFESAGITAAHMVDREAWVTVIERHREATYPRGSHLPLVVAAEILSHRL